MKPMNHNGKEFPHHSHMMKSSLRHQDGSLNFNNECTLCGGGIHGRAGDWDNCTKLEVECTKKFKRD